MTRATLLAALALLAPCAARAQGPTPAAIANAYAFSAEQLNADTAAGDTMYPQYILNDGSAQANTWHFTSKGAWTGGFFVGSLWQEARQTADPRWAALARRWANSTSGSDATHLQSRDTDTSTHDIGFVLVNAFGNALRYGTDADKALAKTVLVQGAASLDTRFNPTVGAIKSHDAKDVPDPYKADFQVIIDNMMNLELLFMGAELTSDSAQRDQWYAHAVTHAQTTIASHFGPDGTRPDDGSTYQAVYFDAATGAVLNKDTVQGISATSTWTRGQAWAVYGYVMCARYAARRGDAAHAAQFQAQAQKAADFYVAHLPADSVALWDFNAPAGDPRDSSSASIAAAGLLELSTLVSSGAKQAAYYGVAGRILASLTSPAYLAQGMDGLLSQSVLLHGSYNVPGAKQDQGLIWGDYYLLEGLQRFQALLPPTSDTYVRSGSYANTNYGKVSTLFVKAPTTAGADERWAYLKFDLSGVKGPVNRARLRLYGANQVAGYAGGASVYGVGDTSWSETKTTWNAKPALSSLLATAPIGSTTQYADWDVTAWVNARRAAGKTSLSLAVKMDTASPSKAYDAFGAREATQNGPQLVLQTY